MCALPKLSCERFAVKTTFVSAVCLTAAIAAYATCDKSLDDFPALPGEEDAARIQRAVNALPEGSLYIPKGVYRMSSTLMVTNRCSIELNRGATLRAEKALEYVVKVDARPIWRTWNLFFNGGIIDGNGLSSCMALDGFSPFYMRNVTFLNGKKFGLRVNGEAGGGGIFANDLYFRCTMRGLAGNTALYSSGCDGTYTDCLAVDWTTGFRMDGGGNRLTGCHAWGGTVPPREGGRFPEMLESSVCFHIAGWHNLVRDCYADTATIGYLVEGGGVQILGSWFLNNTTFKLDDIVIVDQRGGDLVVADCRFSNSPGTKVYRGRPGTKVSWSNNVYCGFGNGDDLPGAARYVCNDRNLKEPVCTEADRWEYVQDEAGIVYESPAGEYLGKRKSRPVVIRVASEEMNRLFPNAGPGREVVIRARATTPDTKTVEVSFTQKDGITWGTNLPLRTEWTETRIPLSELKYFSHWRKTGGETPPAGGLDARKIDRITLFYGIWLCRDSAERPHGFEVSSIRIVGRDAH